MALSLVAFTYNVRYNAPTDRDGAAWPKRKEHVASMIRFHFADVVGLQETTPQQVSDLRELLSEGVHQFDVFSRGRYEDGSGESCAILYRRGRIHCLNAGTFWLSTSPHEPGSVSWNPAFPRIASYCHFEDTLCRRQFLFVNTHLDHISSTARLEGMRVILHEIARVNQEMQLPVILVGDFNDHPGSNVVYAATHQGHLAHAPPLESPLPLPALTDTRALTRFPPFGCTATFTGFHFPPQYKRSGKTQPQHQPSHRQEQGSETHRREQGNETQPRPQPPHRREQGSAVIDYILVSSGFAVEQMGVLPTHWDGRIPSDHRPVMAELRWT